MSLKTAAIILTALSLESCGEVPAPKVANRQLQQIGSRGAGPGEFIEPRGLTLTPDDHLLVADFRNYRIQLLETNGAFIRQWGAQGSEPGQFNDPTQAVMDPLGVLYVADTWNHRIQVKPPDSDWNPNWTEQSDFYAPRGLTVDRQNRLYVANTSLHKIEVFRRDGKHLATWGGKGDALDQMRDPLGLATAPDGNLVVADTGNHRIRILNPAGQTLSVIPVPDWDNGKFNEAYLAVGPDHRIYCTVPHDDCVVVFNQDGTLFSRFGESGSGPEQLSHPTGIAVDRAGLIYISDSQNNRIVKYTPPSSLQSPTAGKPDIHSELISILRILLDLTAALIVVVWIVQRILRKKGPVPVTPVVRIMPESNWDRALQVLRRQRLLLATLYICFVICVITAVNALSDGRIRQGFWLIAAGLAFAWIQELPKSVRLTTFQDRPELRRSYSWGLLFILTVLTVLLRIYRLDDIPWGINNDAAWNGMYALRILDGEPYTPFTPEAWGKCTFYFYLIALSFKWFGVDKASLYLPCITAGILAVIALFFLFRKLFGTRFAFVAAFIYSAMAWNIVFSRTGYRAILAPLCLALTIWLFFKAVDASGWWKRLSYYILSGFFIGLGLHTYFAFRGIPVMMILVGIHTWIREKRFMRRNWWGLIFYLTAGAAAFSPLARYALENRGNLASFMGRSDFLFIGNKIRTAGSLTPLWTNIRENLLMFHHQAHVGNFFNNEWPIVTYPLGLMMLIGLLIMVRHALQRGPFLLMALFAFGLLPGILSEPDAARTIMTPIPVSAFTAAGILSLVRYWKGPVGKKGAAAAVIALTAWIGVTEFKYYFYKLGSDYYAQFGYARKHTLLGYQGLELAAKNTLYISQGHFIDTPKFICYRVPGDVFTITDGEVIDVVPKERLHANLERVLNARHPPDKGVAFLFEKDIRNEPLFGRVKEFYPGGIYTEYRDKAYANDVIFYSYIVPKELLAAATVPEPES
ncbi:glycosyltransferase family 39 protein [bacterium]|nr:glycosyltransferase family 39 protein [candidate division CSSED10-310 bacterium]